jgi:HD-like signal output (HDOD) protein
MSVAQRTDVKIDEVVKLLEQDSLIAGRVLKVVGSAVYTGVGKVTSLREATLRLGLNTIRDLVVEIAMNMRVFKSTEYAETMELLRRHATATAHLCRVVSRYTTIDAEFSFLTGLLHDVGIAGTLLALSDDKAKRKAPPDLISIWPALDRVHQRAGELMASHWALPPDIRFALSAHHQVLLQGYPHPLAATVAIANELAHELGAGVTPRASDADEKPDEERDCLRAHAGVDRSPAATLAQASEALGLAEANLSLIRREAEDVIASLSQSDRESERRAG